MSTPNPITSIKIGTTSYPIGEEIAIDEELDESSSNPVENAVITEALSQKAQTLNSHGVIYLGSGTYDLDEIYPGCGYDEDITDENGNYPFVQTYILNSTSGRFTNIPPNSSFSMCILTCYKSESYTGTFLGGSPYYIQTIFIPTHALAADDPPQFYYRQATIYDEELYWSDWYSPAAALENALSDKFQVVSSLPNSLESDTFYFVRS